MLSHLLHLAGIDSVILENRSRDYIESRMRAGLIEQWARDLLIETGVGERMQREALSHNGIHFCFDGALHHINFQKLVGKGVTIYGQQEVVKDLVARRLADGGQILFEVDDVSVHDFNGGAPKIRFRHEGKGGTLDCDFIGGCDGFHGMCRPSVPSGVLTDYDREYPFGWVGILSESPPPDDELIYAYHDRGFALYTMRSPTLARLYIQCAPDDDIENWPDARIWQELHARLAGTRALAEGKIVQKGMTAMRSFVVEPMRHGRLFLAGDSAHIQPPTGAKGMNLAFADVVVLVSRAHGVLSLRPQRSAGALFADLPAPGVEGAAVLVVDDADVASASDPQCLRPQAPVCRTRLRGAVRKRRRRSLAENYVGLPVEV